MFYDQDVSLFSICHRIIVIGNSVRRSMTKNLEIRYPSQRFQNNFFQKKIFKEETNFNFPPVLFRQKFIAFSLFLMGIHKFEIRGFILNPHSLQLSGFLKENTFLSKPHSPFLLVPSQCHLNHYHSKKSLKKHQECRTLLSSETSLRYEFVTHSSWMEGPINSQGKEGGGNFKYA